MVHNTSGFNNWLYILTIFQAAPLCSHNHKFRLEEKQYQCSHNAATSHRCHRESSFVFSVLGILVPGKGMPDIYPPLCVCVFPLLNRVLLQLLPIVSSLVDFVLVCAQMMRLVEVLHVMTVMVVVVAVK